MRQEINGLSFLKFKQTLEKMRDISDAETQVSTIYRNLNNKYQKCSQAGYLPNMAFDVVSLLEIILDDKAGWIDYWVWEKDFGRKTDLKVYDTDGVTELPSTTIEDLWTLVTGEKI